ncbi:MAG TPA: saccharopine dehydrogenase NADP-binding domain-containing protein [Candidatus Sulfotelmatobacter sp.]|nr:saccharopine dehydrogenase NADP-binding domain-containing protein [Candidatus Sulfotelmatobacter sp.]
MTIAVVGATGHTGRFVLAELVRRGIPAVAIGRVPAKLAALAAAPGVQTRVAAIDDPLALDRALAGTDAVIHCAGPFLDTAVPVIAAALRARIHYVDLTAEQMSALSTFLAFDAPARAAGIVLAPAAGFFGGLGDLVATSALGDWAQADEVELRIALDHWWPTRGTRETGARNAFARLVREHGTLAVLQPGRHGGWDAGAPFGTVQLVPMPFSEIVLMAHHLNVSTLRSFLSENALRDVRDGATPEPLAADERGRSTQRFVLEALARKDGAERRARVRGRDIYAVSAPLVVETATRLCAGAGAPGARALGELFDADAFLDALGEHLAR